MIIAKNIHKFYGNQHILKGINLDVKKGEIVSLVGSSGAGKTTLLQILGTIDKYDKNDKSSLKLCGIDIFKLNDNSLADFRNNEIGFVFQFHQLLPEFTLIENICLPAYIKKIKKSVAEEKAMELINYFNLEKIIHNKPNELSGGEKQRAAVARALINKPSIILADEPSGNLDSKSAENLYNLFFKLRKDFNYTFLIATHNTNYAKKSDRVFEIIDGKIN